MTDFVSKKFSEYNFNWWTVSLNFGVFWLELSSYQLFYIIPALNLTGKDIEYIELVSSISLYLQKSFHPWYLEFY